MAKRPHAKKAPVWLTERSAKPCKPRTESTQKATAPEETVTDVKGAIHGTDAQPIKVDGHSEADLQRMLERIRQMGHPWGMRIAGSRLLRAVADLSTLKHLRRGQVEHLRARLVMEIQTFEKLCHQSGFDRNHIVGASYCLCAALDEAAHHTPWGGGGKDAIGTWSLHSLTAQFHGNRDGGTQVYQLLGRLVEDPDANLPLIHLVYIIMSLGFMGSYRQKQNGDREHHLLREKLHAIVQSRVGPVARELSASLHVASERNLKPMRSIPVWMTALAGLAIIAGTYAYFEFRLNEAHEAALKTLENVNQMVTAPPLPALDVQKFRPNGEPDHQPPRNR